MTTIADAADQVRAHRAPVIFLDSCSLLDLFRADTTRGRPRVRVDEIRTAAELLNSAATPPLTYLVVPELVPGEFADHADRIEKEFDKWLKSYDENQAWLAEGASYVGKSLPVPTSVQAAGLHTGFRQLAENLLGRAIVLARDQSCLDRAVARLIAKRRPSHDKEMKDSMNLEQCLELCRRLRDSGVSDERIFVSSNTKDFAEPSSRLHPELEPDFNAAALNYFTSLQAGVGYLRGKGQFQLP